MAAQCFDWLATRAPASCRKLDYPSGFSAWRFPPHGVFANICQVFCLIKMSCNARATASQSICRLLTFPKFMTAAAVISLDKTIFGKSAGKVGLKLQRSACCSGSGAGARAQARPDAAASRAALCVKKWQMPIQCKTLAKAKVFQPGAESANSRPSNLNRPASVASLSACWPWVRMAGIGSTLRLKLGRSAVKKEPTQSSCPAYVWAPPLTLHSILQPPKSRPQARPKDSDVAM